MSTLLGELIGRVEAVPVIDETTGRKERQASGRDEPEYLSGLITEINRVIEPPVPVSTETVHLRAMEVISDEVNEHGGRFAVEEFTRLCELIVDSPVLIAHDKRQLPVARNFKAGVVSRDGRPWIKVWFYWPKNASGAEDLASRIDAGVLREVSIGFEFKRPECSVCGGDIRECDHRPAVEYEHPDGVVRPAHYLYREIVRVLETSLVYRGATPGTRIGAGLFFNVPGKEVPAETLSGEANNFPAESEMRKDVELLFDAALRGGAPLADLADLPSADLAGNRFIVAPLVDGLPVVAVGRAGEVFLFSPEDEEISEKLPLVVNSLRRACTDDFTVFGWLLHPSRKMKSPEPVLHLQWLGRLGNENILQVPVLKNQQLLSKVFLSGGVIKPLFYKEVNRKNIPMALPSSVSSYGVRICPSTSSLQDGSPAYEWRRKGRLWGQIVARESSSEGGWQYRLAFEGRRDLFEIDELVSSVHRFEIGRIVPINGEPAVDERGGLHLSNLKIIYSPIQRNRADSVDAVCRIAKIRHPQFALRTSHTSCSGTAAGGILIPAADNSRQKVRQA